MQVPTTDARADCTWWGDNAPDGRYGRLFWPALPVFHVVHCIHHAVCMGGGCLNLIKLLSLKYIQYIIFINAAWQYVLGTPSLPDISPLEATYLRKILPECVWVRQVPPAGACSRGQSPRYCAVGSHIFCYKGQFQSPGGLFITNYIQCCRSAFGYAKSRLQNLINTLPFIGQFPSQIANLDLGRAPYVSYAVKYILAQYPLPFIGQPPSQVLTLRPFFFQNGAKPGFEMCFGLAPAPRVLGPKHVSNPY